jgi:thiamine transport system ATP-binding protein
MVSGGVGRCELGEVALPWAPDGPARVGLRPTALRLAVDGVAGEVLHRVHRRDHVRLEVRLTGEAVVDKVADQRTTDTVTHERTVDAVAGVRVVDAVAGVADAPEVGTTVHLILDPDGVALLPATGSH